MKVKFNEAKGAKTVEELANPDNQLVFRVSQMALFYFNNRTQQDRYTHVNIKFLCQYMSFLNRKQDLKGSN